MAGHDGGLVERLPVRGQGGVAGAVDARQPGLVEGLVLTGVEPNAADLVGAPQLIMRIGVCRAARQGHQPQQEKGAVHPVTRSPIVPTAMA